MRLNRYLSACGLGSRRSSEALILEGRVTVNGKICVNLGTDVAETDEVTVDGRKTRKDKSIVLALHKPRGYICSRGDDRDRETIYALLPREHSTLHHVGRLDKDSQGLLLMTNRGELTHKLMHPSQGVEKEYEVTIEEPFNPEHIAKLTHGISTEEGMARAERAWVIGNYKIGIVLKQGLKRQIRLMLYALGYEVRRLIRVRIGGLLLKGLPEGGWRALSESQVDKLLLKAVSKQSSLTRKPGAKVKSGPASKFITVKKTRPSEAMLDEVVELRPRRKKRPTRKSVDDRRGPRAGAEPRPSPKPKARPEKPTKSTFRDESDSGASMTSRNGFAFNEEQNIRPSKKRTFTKNSSETKKADTPDRAAKRKAIGEEPVKHKRLTGDQRFWDHNKPKGAINKRPSSRPIKGSSGF